MAKNLEVLTHQMSNTHSEFASEVRDLNDPSQVWFRPSPSQGNLEGAAAGGQQGLALSQCDVRAEHWDF